MGEGEGSGEGAKDDIQTDLWSKALLCTVLVRLPSAVTTSHTNPSKATMQPTRGMQLQLHLLLINRQR